MAIRDEYIKVLREDLGEGFETSTLTVLMKEYVARALKPKILARRKSALDNASLIAAREAVETLLKNEEASRRAQEQTVADQLNTDLVGF